MSLYSIISLLGFANIFFHKAVHRSYHTIDLAGQWLHWALCRVLSTKTASLVQHSTLHVDLTSNMWRVPLITKRSLMFLKLRCFLLLGLDSSASYETEPWGLDPINPFSCDYQRIPRITHMNTQNRGNELDLKYTFSGILCPLLASERYLCTAKTLLTTWLTLFQAFLLAILREGAVGLPGNLFRFSSSPKIPPGHIASCLPLPMLESWCFVPWGKWIWQVPAFPQAPSPGAFPGALIALSSGKLWAYLHSLHFKIKSVYFISK